MCAGLEALVEARAGLEGPAGQDQRVLTIERELPRHRRRRARQVSGRLVEQAVRGRVAVTRGLLDDVRQGPAGSRVNEIESREPEPGLRFDGFEVRY